LLVGGSAALDETAATFDVAWIATPTDPRRPVLRSKELR
jgi:hypothetical protein